MSRDTNIGWCDSSVNPTMGCDGCELWNEKTGVKTCYAGVLHERYGKVNKGFSPKFNILTEHPGRMATAAKWSDLRGTDRPAKPWLNGMPRTIFISDMSDALSKNVSFDYLFREIIQVVTSPAGLRHIWMWLTKRPRQMVVFNDYIKSKGVRWPENLWAGTSATEQKTADARIPWLLKVPAALRFLSCEPLLGPVDLGCVMADGPTRWDVLRGVRCDDVDGGMQTETVDWVIVGGESGPGFKQRPIAELRSVYDQCRAAGVPVFVKQDAGADPGMKGRIPDDLWIHEMPRMPFAA